MNASTPKGAPRVLILQSDLTGRVYAVTRYKDRGEGRYEAQTKHDVTDQVRALFKQWMEDDRRLRELADLV